ncbi:hypothetical protein DL768_003798 [Monosporascus sp. mg162]|nr:hypothetical protein DL768_003798 [Monosporascus sp. mg162]
MRTHHPKSINLIEKYQDSEYQGPAVQMGAGVEGGKAYEFADAHGLLVVAGNCPNVGIAGGCIQAVVSAYCPPSLASLPTKCYHGRPLPHQATSSRLTTSPTGNDELFSALRAGSGSTYGIVVSMAIKAFPDTFSSSASLTGGRLIPCELVEDDASSEALVSAIRYITTRTLISGASFNVAHAVSSPDKVAANPYLRKTIFSADKIRYGLSPALPSITPNGGVYLNETDFQATDFQTTFYGDHYKRLFAIKRKYDPDEIFYAKTAVGSDRREQHVDGRLYWIFAEAQ